MSIHRDHRREIHYLELPDGFRSAKLFHQENIGDQFDALGQYLGCPADRVKIYAAILLARFQSFVPHAAFAYHGAQAAIAYDLPLVWLLTNRGGGTCGDTFPISLLILDDDRPAMIENAAFQVNRRWKLPTFVKIFVDRIPTGK